MTTRRAPSHSGSGLRTVQDRLAAAYGPQNWWPARDPFEMMAGALLTQRTTWRNAERAIASLRREGVLSPEALALVPVSRLEALVRMAGTFRTKAVRLRVLARWYVDAGGRDALAARSTASLRSELLALPGIGPETADDILVYAFARPVFVVDAYARRILSRHGWAREDEPYEQLSDTVARAIGPDAALLGEFHALLVEHGKRHCRSAPRCTGCPLAAECRTGRRRAADGAAGRSVR
ncbi:MAG: endonuclease [Chromatiales bacterium]|nr:endonuclease [Chromatiales bacterium]